MIHNYAYIVHVVIHGSRNCAIFYHKIMNRLLVLFMYTCSNNNNNSVINNSVFYRSGIGFYKRNARAVNNKIFWWMENESFSSKVLIIVSCVVCNSSHAPVVGFVVIATFLK